MIMYTYTYIYIYIYAYLYNPKNVLGSSPELPDSYLATWASDKLLCYHLTF